MKKLLPIILALVGIGGGVGAGLALRPAPEEKAHSAEECLPVEKTEDMAEAPEEGEVEDTGMEYVKLNNQFVVPVIKSEKVRALVVMSLSVEVPTGNVEATYSREPKLRDAFLQVLFDHANVGGFDGNFTNSSNMDVLRRSLIEAANGIGGDSISNILITEIARQDM